MKICKHYVLILALGSFTAFVFAQSRIVRGPSMSVEVSMTQTTIKGGYPINVKTVMTNVSSHDVEYSLTNASPLFEKHVTDQHSGSLAPETDAGRILHKWLPGHGIKAGSIFSEDRILLPGKSIETVSDISKEYDVGQPGKYEVWVEVRDPEHRDKRLKSNVIVFTVVPQ